MKIPTLLLLMVAPPLAAQDIAPKDAERDPVLTALLDNAGESSDEESVGMDIAPPLLVTGIPPTEAEAGELAAAVENSPSVPQGVGVEVAGGSASGHVPAKDVQLLAPFPAKPLSPPPAGWKIIQPRDVPAYSKTVQLANGTEVDLSIRPHVLVPDADGSEVFELSEPGFEAELGYAQKHTIGAVLADSISELDHNGARLDDAARRLSELLDSLPAPPVEATDEPEQEP